MNALQIVNALAAHSEAAGNHDVLSDAVRCASNNDIAGLVFVVRAVTKVDAVSFKLACDVAELLGLIYETED